MVVYKAINTVNNKVYIGITITSLQKRKNRHLYDSKNGSNFYFHKALRKYGFDSFEWTVVHTAKTIEELKHMEKVFINDYDSIKNGYNCTIGGDGSFGLKWSEEQKEKIRGKSNCIANLTYRFKKGHIMSDLTKHKISIANKGKSKPDGFSEKLRIANTGKKLSDEHKAKLSKSHIGKNSGDNATSKKLTQCKVNEIRILYKTGCYSSRKLAKMFGLLSKKTILDIIHNRTWKGQNEQ